MNRVRLNLWGNAPAPVPIPDAPSRRRLAESFCCLQDIDFMRDDSGDHLFAKSAEERIVWRELLELELQEIDEQIERITDDAKRRLDHP